MALLLLVMETINYKALLRQMDIRIYGLVIALVFLGIGLLFGYTGFRNFKKEEEGIGEGSHGLSPREFDVLLLMSQGLTNQEIADRLYVSLNTVKTHTSNIYSKLDVQRRTQAIDKARKLNLI